MSCKNCERQEEMIYLDVEQLVAEQLALELDQAEADVQARRYAICQECPFLKQHTCQKCGCFVKFRVALPSKTCPIGKW